MPIVSVIKIILVDYIEYKNKLYEEEKIKEEKKKIKIKKVVIGEEKSDV